jgi:hypothetical protein
MKRVIVSATALVLSMIAALWLAGQSRALLYTLIYLAAVLPGVPLGIALFGWRHAAGWVGGALLGYGLTQLVIWLMIEWHLTSPGAFVLAWMLLLGLTLLVKRAAGPEPAIRMPAWTAPDTAALGVVGWLVAISAGSAASMRALAGAGLALGLATTMNPLLGGCFALIYGAAVAIDALGAGRAWEFLPKQALAALPVMLAVAWGWGSKVMEGAGSALQIGLEGVTENGPVITLVLSLGPILIPSLAGLRRLPGASLRPLWVAGGGIVVGLFLLYVVRISEGSWVGFRAGQILLVSIPILLYGVRIRPGSVFEQPYEPASFDVARRLPALFACGVGLNGLTEIVVLL